MSAQYILCWAKLKQEGRSFWNGEIHSLISGGERVMLTIIKVVIILFLIKGIGNILAIFKINQ